MKFILLFVCSTTLTSISFAQSTNTVQKESAFDAGFQEYCKKYALSTIEISQDKAGVKLSGELNAVNVENPTYLDYGIVLKETEAQYFSVKNSNKLIKVESLYRLRLGYNAQKKS